jgi:hypothetical protein
MICGKMIVYLRRSNMFYSYLIKSSFISSCLPEITSGALFEFSMGYVRHIIEDNGSCSFVIRDRSRDVVYRASSDQLVVSRGESGHRPHQQIKIQIPKRRTGTMVLLDFLDLDERKDVENFINVCKDMEREHERRSGMKSMISAFFKDPVGKIILIAGLVYAMVTVFVLIAG